MESSRVGKKQAEQAAAQSSRFLARVTAKGP
jgi:hypothetical protein